MKRRFQLLTLAAAVSAQAKVDLTTVPARDATQLTIYNSADLTLASETRALTLKKGVNKLQFSWENTLIDPTSLEMRPLKHAADIDVLDLVYPPRTRNLGLWTVDSRISGAAPVEISYLTSGLSWRAFYMGTLSPDEKTLRLQGYVRVANSSGEDYENAQVRLIVGKVHLLDQIAALARKEHPYGSPIRPRPRKRRITKAKKTDVSFSMPEHGDLGSEFGFTDEPAPKRIIKEGLSEYFLYTIEGVETIPNTWAKRLPSFDVANVPVENFYKYDEQRYGRQARRFLSFKNDEAHELGETPIPGGAMRVYRGTDDAHLSFEGQSSFQYIPVDEKVELDLGAVANVIVEPKLMKQATANFHYNRGNISGWDEIRDFTVEIRNTRAVPVRIEITRDFGTSYWSLEKRGDFGTYEKDDANTVKFTLELPAESEKTFTYQLTTRQGTNQ